MPTTIDNIIGTITQAPAVQPIQVKAPTLQNLPRHADVNPFAQENRGFYSTMYEHLFKGETPETPEEKSKREKRERSRANILALSDGLASVANIWATTKGAPAMNLPSLSEANRKRYDYADRVRKENELSWKRGTMQARMADMNARKQNESAQAKAETDTRDFAYKVDKENRDYALNFNKWLADQGHQATKNDLDKESLEETKRANKARESVMRQNADTATQRASSVSSGSSDSYYSIVGSDNKPIRVRKEAWRNYSGEIAQKIIDASAASGDGSITALIKSSFNLNPQGTLETIVHRYLPQFPEIEAYAKKRAEELESAFSGIHETNPNQGAGMGINWADYFDIPNM